MIILNTNITTVNQYLLIGLYRKTLRFKKLKIMLLSFSKLRGNNLLRILINDNLSLLCMTFLFSRIIFLLLIFPVFYCFSRTFSLFFGRSTGDSVTSNKIVLPLALSSYKAFFPGK